MPGHFVDICMHGWKLRMSACCYYCCIESRWSQGLTELHTLPDQTWLSWGYSYQSDTFLPVR
jgi:hypothetical protein